MNSDVCDSTLLIVIALIKSRTSTLLVEFIKHVFIMNPSVTMVDLNLNDSKANDTKILKPCGFSPEL